jgi:hypothetical protein
MERDPSWNEAAWRRINANARQRIEGLDLALMPGYVEGEPLWQTDGRYSNAVLDVTHRKPSPSDPPWHAEVRRWMDKRNTAEAVEDARIRADRLGTKEAA